ncbi:KOW domain-containing RNA-binding protein [Paenibacillus sp. GYB003]|uniref:KOW domain-containing RNA-binding protein n=1 Tax=Paenibacillus sp. GYB003 TaxID=2994392 RepID=UPI002F9634C1
MYVANSNSGHSPSDVAISGNGGQALTPEIGRIVKVLRGREQEKYAVIVRIIDDRFVAIADGSKRKFDGPKKKNLLHLELLPEVSGEVANSILETGRVTNGKLRFALGNYLRRVQAEAHEKGE